MFEEGNCFWIETNLDRNGNLQGHFFILILKCDNEKIVLANIDKTRGKKRYDTTTILHAGEGHEFVVEESYVNYDFSELTTIDKITTMLENRTAAYRGVMDAAIVQRICDGILKSKFTPYEVREAFEDRLYKNLP